MAELTEHEKRLVLLAINTLQERGVRVIKEYQEMADTEPFRSWVEETKAEYETLKSAKEKLGLV